SAATKRRAPAAAPRARQTAPVVDDSNAEALRIRAEGLEAALRQIAAATQRASAELATLNADIAQTQPGTTSNEEEDQ
ncbi:MAG: hypothetical protein KDB04_18140, partial [Acidimicrobiales bacterium]|nr:hypothetical protein [Acidimicrobiales bacterium]